MTRAEQRALEAYPVKQRYNDYYGDYEDINVVERVSFQEGYEQAEKDLGWHPSTEYPPVDEEVIVLLGSYDDLLEIAFGHIVNKDIAVDYDGWNIPGVRYWMPMPEIPKEGRK